MSGTLLDAFLRGELRRFFGAHFREPEDRRAAVTRALRPLTPAVASALEAQHERHAPSPARAGHLAALREGAAAVVTGQQVGLFSGPLYSVYKAASAVAVARALSAETGAPVVPVFWLQTEDHDLPEIASTWVPTPRGPLQLALPASPEDRRSIAHVALPQAVSGCLDQLRDELLALPHAAPHLERLARHYRPGATWGDAFAGVLAELFAHEGLVILDPRDPALLAAAAPVFRGALTRAAELAEGLAVQGEALAAAGLPAQVHVRPGSPLCFFHPEGATGPRHRLDCVDGGFRELSRGRRYGSAELLAALEAEPLRFSTSALLRPVVQDTLLPTAAYVGGPGEIAYFAQLGPVYRAFGMEPPLVVPRARFRVLEEKTRRLLERLGLQPEDAARPEDELLLRAAGAAGEAEGAALAARLLAPFDEALGGLMAEHGHLDAGLAKAAEKTRATVEMAAGKLAGKIEKAMLHRDRAVVEDVRRLKWALWPNGAPDERVYGLPYFAARHGEQAFLERIFAGIEPFEPALRELLP